MKNKKKLLSLLLSISMLASLGANAFAEENKQPKEAPQIIEEEMISEAPIEVEAEITSELQTALFFSFGDPVNATNAMGSSYVEGQTKHGVLTFAGWYDEADGTKLVGNPTAAHTYNARWESDLVVNSLLNTEVYSMDDAVLTLYEALKYVYDDMAKVDEDGNAYITFADSLYVDNTVKINPFYQVEGGFDYYYPISDQGDGAVKALHIEAPQGKSIVFDGGNTFTPQGVSNQDGKGLLYVYSYNMDVYLKGLTFQNAYHEYCAGLYISTGDDCMTYVNDCKFLNNGTETYGAALANFSPAVIEDCTFTGNYLIGNYTRGGTTIDCNDDTTFKGINVVSESEDCEEDFRNQYGSVCAYTGTLTVEDGTLTIDGEEDSLKTTVNTNIVIKSNAEVVIRTTPTEENYQEAIFTGTVQNNGVITLILAGDLVKGKTYKLVKNPLEDGMPTLATFGEVVVKDTANKEYNVKIDSDGDLAFRYVSNGGGGKPTYVYTGASGNPDGETYKTDYTETVTKEEVTEETEEAQEAQEAQEVQENEFADKVVLALGSKSINLFGNVIENDVAPISKNNRTMLPARVIAEALGATVGYDASTKTVSIINEEEGIEIYLTLDSDVAIVNGEQVKLDSPAFAQNNRTYTPLRFIAENLGAQVEWNQDTQEVTITK